MRVSADPPNRMHAAPRIPTGFLAGTACVLLAMAVTAGTAWLGVRRADERTELRLQVAAAEAAHRLDAGMSQPSRDLTLLSELAALRPVWGGDPAQLRGLLGQSQASLPAYAWVAFAGPDGTVRAATDDRLSGSSLAARPWFNAGRLGPVVSESGAGDDPSRTVEVAVPVRDGDRVVGVLCGQLDAVWMSSLLDGVAPPAEPGRSPMALQVLSASGRPVLGFPDRLLDAGLTDATFTLPASLAATREAGGSGLRWTVLAREDRHAIDVPLAAVLVLTLFSAGVASAWLLARRVRDVSRPDDAPAAPAPARFATQIESLRQLADADLMTGLLNRRGFLGAAPGLTAGPAARGVLIVDIDDLRTVNERLDHATGDSVICAVAAAIQGMVRQSDLVARLGGEEFAVLMSGDAERLRTLAERIRCASQQFVTTSDAVVTVTVSIGGVVWDGPNLDMQDVLERADAALCRAKEGGRNCIRVERIAATGLPAR